MEEINFLQVLPTHFLVGLGLSFLAGFIIGLERESKGKPAGIRYSMSCHWRLNDFFLYIWSC